METATKKAPLREQRTLHSLSNAAPALGVSIDTLRDWVRAGRIPSVRVGQKYMIASDTIAKIQREGI